MKENAPSALWLTDFLKKHPELVLWVSLHKRGRTYVASSPPCYVRVYVSRPDIAPETGQIQDITRGIATLTGARYDSNSESIRLHGMGSWTQQLQHWLELAGSTNKFQMVR